MPRCPHGVWYWIDPPRIHHSGDPNEAMVYCGKPEGWEPPTDSQIIRELVGDEPRSAQVDGLVQRIIGPHD